MNYKICHECGIAYRPTEVRDICPGCDGTGTSIFESDGICKYCRGKGVVDEVVDRGMCEYCHIKMKDQINGGTFIGSIQNEMDLAFENTKIGGER